MNGELIVFVTTASEEEAASIADTLVTERFAACVNIVPTVESIYRWEGKVTRDREALMIIKTTDERYADLERRVKELHSYSTPEVIALEIKHGSPSYLDWLRESVVRSDAAR
jgi:periplasmic divalent cation tolerance protein